MEERKDNKKIVENKEGLIEAFWFVEDKKLKNNLDTVLEYVTTSFLLIKKNKIFVTKATSSAAYRDSIIHGGSIMEAILHYCINEYAKAGLIDEILKKYEWKLCENTKNKQLETALLLEDNKKILLKVVERKECSRLEGRLNLAEINKISEESEILTPNLFKKAERIREDRNEIHLQGCKYNIKEYFTAQKMERVFDDVFKILLRVENKIIDLP
jgi:hypothetical protein